MSELEWRHRDKIMQSVWNSWRDSRRGENACWSSDWIYLIRICQNDNWKCTSAFSKILFFHCMYVFMYIYCLPFHCFIDRTALRGDRKHDESEGGWHAWQGATGQTAVRNRASLHGTPALPTGLLGRPARFYNIHINVEYKARFCYQVLNLEHQQSGRK